MEASELFDVIFHIAKISHPEIYTLERLEETVEKVLILLKEVEYLKNHPDSPRLSCSIHYVYE